MLASLAGCSKNEDLAGSCCSDKDFQIKNGHAPHVYLVPNVITPNNDGFNDTFIVGALDTSKTAPSRYAVFAVRKLAVFRTTNATQLVYQNDKYQNDFNGHDNNGRELTDGQYYFVLQLDGVAITGNVCIARSLKPCRCRSVDPNDAMLPNCQ